MAVNQPSQLLNFAGLQMAAEAFLDELPAKDDPGYRQALVAALAVGNGRASRFPATLAEEFADTFDIIAQKENTATGFSGTLFRSKVTDATRGLVAGEYTLSIRSTEFVNDAIRDSTGTNDLEIRQIGWALGQLADLDDWYKELTAAGSQDPNTGLPPDTPFNVTGYSLGGHLATAFALLQRQRGQDQLLKHIYTFNGAGTGGITTGHDLPAILAEFKRLRGLPGPSGPVSIDDLVETRSRMLAVNLEFRRLDEFANKAATFLSGSTPPTGAYPEFGYQLAAVRASKYTVPSSNFPNPLGDISTIPLTPTFAKTAPFDNMTEIVGADGGEIGTSLFDGRFSFVSFSGQHYSKPENYLGVYIEDQPLTRGSYSLALMRGRLAENPDKNSFADTHSLVLLVDSLSLMSAMTQLVPSLTQLQIEAIFKAASNSKATRVNGTDGEAEGDTLEAVLDSLRRVFMGPDVKPTTRNLAGNTWHDLALRDEFYANLRGLQNQPRFQQAIGVANIELLPADAAVVEGKARDDISYRFALRYLSPFAVTNKPDLYDQYNTNGELEIFNPATGRGFLTDEYLADRAAMLAARMDMAVRNSAFSAGAAGAPSVLYDDAGSKQHSLVFDSATATDLARPWDGRPYAEREQHMERLFARQLQKDKGRKILFGRDADPKVPNADPDTEAGGHDVLTGGNLDDHLYGGGGNDTLRGGLGDDYLEGGVGDDVLRGGPSGTSLPFGITDNDTLVGGPGNDKLYGGLGTDKYYFYTGGGGDTVFDVAEGAATAKRQLGEIYFNDVHVTGQFLPVGPDKKNFTFNGPDGLYRASYFGDVNTATPGMLVLWKDTDGSNVVTLTNFISGDFGITLDPNAPARQYTDKVGTDGPDNSNLVAIPHEASLASDSPDQRVLGLGGADYIQATHANVQAYGGADNDYLTNGEGDQQLYGQEGRDVLVASAGDDSLYGGTEDDALQGGADNDYLEGNEGNDVLDGGPGQDVILGGDGNDFIFGGGSVTVAISDWDAFANNSLDWGAFDATGNVVLRGLTGLSNVEGDALDVIDGGAGNDWVFAGDGADTVSGGTGNDYLVGQAGDDSISGDEDGDFIYGDGAQGDLSAAPGNFSVFTLPQFHGNDTLSGGGGNDYISGDGGADDLYGGDGDDTLIGDSANVPEQYHGADYLDGGDGNDLLLGYGKDDTLFGGAGNDTLGGDSSSIADSLHGNDYLDGEDGNDTLHGDGGSDELFGGAGDDILDGDASNVAFEYHGDDYLDGEDGNDALQGGGGSDRLFGGAGNDSLVGDGPGVPVAYSGNDYLDGEAGDDVLEGGAGNDTLVGGPGSDILRGQAGDDVYVLSTGDQTDFVDDREGVNTIRFGASVTQTFQSLGSDGNAYLALRYGSSDIVYVRDGLTNDAIRYQLPDGTVKTAADWRTSFNSFSYHYGSSGADTLSGTVLADLFIPGNGNDTIEFGPGSGFDRVAGFGQVAGESQGTDTIRVGGGLIAADVEVSRDLNGNLTLTLTATGDMLRIDGWSASASRAHAGFQVQFDDATGLTRDDLVALAVAPTAGDDVLVGGDDADAIDGGAGDDVIYGDNSSNAQGGGNDVLLGGEGDDRIYGGSGDDTLDGGPGNDSLSGNAGADTYLFGVGDGSDVITDNGGEGNVVELKPGIAPEDVTLTQGSIVLTLNATGETLTIGDWYGDGGALGAPRFAVDSIRFADGTEWDPSLINEQANHSTPFADRLRGIDTDDVLSGLDGDDTIDGYSGNDVLAGGGGNDTIDGGEGADDLAGGPGNDVLHGGAGNDVLEGGPGDDELVGSYGDDTYVFGAGDGDDLIWGETSFPQEGSNQDEIVFKAGITPTDLRVIDNGTGLVLDYGTGSVRTGMASGSGVGISLVRFADGTVWTSDDVVSRAEHPPKSYVGTDSDDTINGGDGDDLIDGGAGQDRLFGNAGDDTLLGGPGFDSLIGGDGNDALFGGEGGDTLNAGEGDDFLDGGPGDDQLIGGHGNDVFRFGLDTGDDLVNDARIDPFQSLSLPGELNEIRVDPGIAPADVAVSRDGNNLLLETAGGASSMTVAGWFTGLYGPDALVVRFDDGTEWDTATLVSMAGVAPWSGNDDVLGGTPGDDILAGGYGNDTYLFGIGSGHDTIEEAGGGSQGLNRATAGTRDTIRFGPGVGPQDVSVAFSFDRPKFTIAGSGDTLTIASWGDNVARVELAEFDDGTVWDLGQFSHWGTGTNAGPDVEDLVTGSSRNFGAQYGGTARMGMNDETFFGLQYNDSVYDIRGNNTLYGGGGNDNLGTDSGDDLLDGGAGNDVLSPGTGDNRIRFGRGYGQDTLYFYGQPNDLGTDTVELGEDVAVDQVRLRRGPNSSLILELAGTPDVLTVNGSLRGLAGRDRLRLEFADGTVWGTDEIEARLQGVSLIEGGTGNNTLVGGDGDDIFIGGEGNDTLTGGGGRDTFLFDRGDGTDTIFDEAPHIVLGDGIRPEDVSLYGSNFASGQYDLNIQILGGGGLIVAKNWFPPTHSGTIEFADGTVWDTIYVGSRVPFGFVQYGRGAFTGTPGDDTYSLGSTPDTMRGNAGDDVLSSDGGNDELDGGPGDDTLDGGAGDDQLQGDEGNDRLLGGAGDDMLAGGAGDDVLDAGVDTPGAGETDRDRLYGAEGNDTLVGRAGSDTLSGGKGDDLLDAGEGNDLLDGGAGDDTLDGGPGDDRLYGGPGSDTYLFGIGSGNDTLLDFDTTGSALDTVRLGAGVAPLDVEIIQDGADLVLRLTASGDSLAIRTFGRAGYGIERVEFEDGTAWDGADLRSRAVAVPARDRADVIYGGAGDETIDGLAGDDFIDAGAGGDTVLGGPGDDILQGGDGDDVLDGGPGFDQLVGGAGADTFVVRTDSGSDSIGDFGAGDTLSFGPGIVPADVHASRDVEILYLDVAPTGQWIALENWFANGAQGTIRFDDGTTWDGASLKASVDAITDGDDFLVGTDAPETIAALAGRDTVHGLAGDDILLGGADSDSLYGEDGNDSLFGEAGYDLLSGGPGNDALDGGADDDALSGDSGDDALVGGDGFDSLSGGEGNDVLDGGAGDDLLQGDAGNDALSGGEGNDSLAGGAGDDTLEGGPGDDALDGGLGSNTYVFAPGFGFDTLTEAQDTLGVETLRFNGIAPADVSFSWIGNDYFVEIAGSTDRVRLPDAAISWWVRPNAFEFDDGTVWDQLGMFMRLARYGTEGNDVLSGLWLYGLAGDDILTGSGADNVFDGGDGADRLIGLAGNDRLIGGAGADTLDGGDGNDFLDGGAGDDSLTGGPGDDTYRFGRGYGQDVIFNADSGAGRVDALELADDVLPQDISVARSGAHLTLAIGGADGLRVDNWYTGREYQLDEVRFGDGTVWSAAQLEAGIVLPSATDGDDLLFGTSGNDTIDGLAGNDRIEGDAGDDTLSGGVGDDLDTLDGGPGNDSLSGGTGGDTYRFGFGSGFDSLAELDADTSNIDVVAIDAQSAEVAITRDSSNVYLTLTGGADRLTLQSWWSGSAYRVEEVRLADGTVWDTESINILANGGSLVPPPATEGPDTIYGTSRGDTIGRRRRPAGRRR